MNNEFDYVNLRDSNSPQPQPQPQSQPQFVTYVPYGLTPKTFEERSEMLVMGVNKITMIF